LWGEFKSRFGWKVSAFLIDLSCDDVNEKLPLLVLSRRIASGFFLAYIPWGPEFPSSFPSAQRQKAAAQLADKLKPFLSRNTAFVRFEPPWFFMDGAEQDIETEKLFLSAGFRRAAAAVQPPDTVIINLNYSPEEILSRMKPKWRYNISLAEKKGVSVNTCGADDMDIFYSLLMETAKRDGIAVHGIGYYRTLFELCAQDKESVSLRLYTASHENDTLAAIVVLFRGKDATYLYGASSNNKRSLMAPYALQWKAMKDAKEMGCANYDLFGIPPDEDPNHPMAGLYRFKTGFGGQIIHRAGTWDYPYKPVIYSIFSLAEKIRKKIMNLRKKKKSTTPP